MTPEELINTWKETARRYRYALDERNPERIEKAAKICISLFDGACICKPRERHRCPCDEMHKDIETTGHCFCKIFFDPKRLNSI